MSGSLRFSYGFAGIACQCQDVLHFRFVLISLLVFKTFKNKCAYITSGL